MFELNESKLLEMFSTEPCILFIGEGYDLSDENNKRILALPWSCIFTTTSDNELSHLLSNNNRRSRDITDTEQLYKDALDKRNLKIVRLFDNMQLQKREAQITALKFLNRIQEMIPNVGMLFIVGYNESDILSVDKMCDFLISLRNKSTLFFDFKGSLLETDILGILNEKEFYYTEQNISDIITYSVSEEDYQESSDDNLKVFVNGNVISIKKDMVEVLNQYALLLNYSEINSVQVPPYLIENYFYTFLKQSAYSPEWYCYANGFNLKRDFEEELYKKTKNGLDNPNKKARKPMCLYGQSGSGKSIAIAYLAYRIFNEKEYPIIYINNPYIDFRIISTNDNNEIKKVKSKQLEAMYEIVDKLNADSILILWDLSAATRKDREKVLYLFNLLKNRGTNAYIVFTSYENFDESEKRVSDAGKDYPFNRIEATIAIEDEKTISDFKTILKRKAHYLLMNVTI